MSRSDKIHTLFCIKNKPATIISVGDTNHHSKKIYCKFTPRVKSKTLKKTALLLNEKQKGNEIPRASGTQRTFFTRQTYLPKILEGKFSHTDHPKVSETPW